MNTLALLLTLVSITPDDVQRYAAAQRAYVERARQTAQQDIRDARAAIARARRSGANANADKQKIVNANGILEQLADFRGRPELATFEVGEIGQLSNKDGLFYRIIQIRGEQVEVAPEFEALGSSYDNGRTFINRTIPVGRHLILHPSDINSVGDDVDYYKPSDVFEVTGLQDGKPILREFDAKAAQAELDKLPKVKRGAIKPH